MTLPSPSPPRQEALAAIARIVREAEPFGPLVLEQEEDKPKRPRKPALAGGSEGTPNKQEGGGGEAPPQEPPRHDDEGDDGGDNRIPPEAIELSALEPLNDVGNGQRLLHHFGASILHVREVGWHVWIETHWSKEGGDEQVTRYAQLTAARIKLERSYLGHTKHEQEVIEAGDKAKDELAKLDAIAMHSDEQKARIAELQLAMTIARIAKGELGKRKSARAKFSVSCGNTSKINGMITQGLPHKTVAPADLDRDPHAFNVTNGTLRFMQVKDDECPDPDVVRLKWSVRLYPHRREDLISKCAPVAYDEAAICPQWDAFLEKVQPLQHMREFLRDFHGYGLTGLTGIQGLVFNSGTGANGKSTFIEAIMRLLGLYGDTLNPESFTGQQQKRGDQATPDIADLPGVRLLRVSELPEKAKLQEPLVKALTGGEPMKARHNYAKRFFTFYPVFKVSMSGNAKPDIHDISEGMWRRLMIVPWGVMIPKAERKEFEEMQRIFEAERSGILNWLIAGALAYLNDGRLSIPDEVIEATAEHRDDMDPIGQFLASCCERVEGAKTSGGLLYSYYEAWCQVSGLRPLHNTTFGKTVPKHGWVKAKINGFMQYLDMQMHAEAPKPENMQRSASSPRDPPSGFSY